MEDPKTEKIESEETEFPIKRKVISDNMIMINPSQNEPVENEEDIENIEEKAVNDSSLKSHREDIRGSRRGTTLTIADNGDPLRISLASSEHPTSRQEPLRICLNGEINLDLREDQSDDD